MPTRRSLLTCTFAAAFAAMTGAASAADASQHVPQQKHPDVIAAKVRLSGKDTFDFDVTVSSPYDTPQRYADAFRVMGKDGKVYGERTLFHDHASEQPFTRDLYGVKIPGPVRVVVIQGRDKQFGYGGKVVEVALPER
jgi:hypothetical protein